MSKDYEFTVGTTAYNEEENIGKFLNAVQNQSLGKFKIKKIIIVASGCTDNTVPVIKKYQEKDKRIKLIVQKEREGKAVAVNLILKELKTKFAILQSSDTLPSKSCYRYLLSKLSQDEVGLVAGKVVPKDKKDTFLGFANNFKWDLHHQINLKYPDRPKVGELLAFKKIFEQIPPETAVDEASIEPLIHLQGYAIAYEPRAIIYNKGPQNIREYLSGRRRIYAGHFITKRKYAYEVATLNPLRIFVVYLENMEFSLEYLVKTMFIVFLEGFSRIYGYLDIKLTLRDHTVWKIAPTTKKL